MSGTQPDPEALGSWMQKLSEVHALVFANADQTAEFLEGLGKLTKDEHVNLCFALRPFLLNNAYCSERAVALLKDKGLSIPAAEIYERLLLLGVNPLSDMIVPA